MLDDDRDRDEVAFFHQLLQEYFAARQLTKTPCPDLVAAPWRSADISPSVPQLLHELEASAFWHDPRLNRPSVPVVGVFWFEARAYCAWLSAESGLVLRLPSEVEWEAAARGPGDQAFPWGDDDDAFRANTINARIHRSTPVGVFVEGDSACGAADCAGNDFEWTLRGPVAIT